MTPGLPDLLSLLPGDPAIVHRQVALALAVAIHLVASAVARFASPRLRHRFRALGEALAGHLRPILRHAIAALVMALAVAFWPIGDFAHLILSAALALSLSLLAVHILRSLAIARLAVLPIIQAIDEAFTEGKHRNIKTSITVGSPGMRRSKHRAFVAYDKYLERLADWSNPGPYQARILDWLRETLRLELKLYSDGLRHRGLQLGRAWRDVDVMELYFGFIESFGLKACMQPLLTADEEAMLTHSERRVYKRWLKGESLAEQFDSRSTRTKYTNAIYKKTQINISSNRRPDPLQPVDTRDVFRQDNLMTIPEWAVGTPYFAAPSQRWLGE